MKKILRFSINVENYQVENFNRFIKLPGRKFQHIFKKFPKYIALREISKILCLSQDFQNFEIFAIFSNFRDFQGIPYIPDTAFFTTILEDALKFGYIDEKMAEELRQQEQDDDDNNNQ